MIRRSTRFRRVKQDNIAIVLDLKNSICRLYNANDKPIGQSEWSICSKDKNMYISDFEIKCAYRGHGYGNFLARVLIDLARLYHCKTVTLIDGASLEGFWQRLGFKQRDSYSQCEMEL